MNEQPQTPAPIEQTIIVKSSSGSWSTIITLIIIVGAIVFGALYVWGERVAETRNAPEPTGVETEINL